MNRNEITAGISALLQGDASLGRKWLRPPELIHIPYKGSRENFFLLISLYESPAFVDQVQLLEECMAVARIAITSEFLVDEKAVEIAAYAVEPGKLRRVIRFTVSNSAFLLALKVESAELLGDKKPDGFVVDLALSI